MFHFVFIAEEKTFVRSGRSGCHDGPKRRRYSIEFANLVSLPARVNPRSSAGRRHGPNLFLYSGELTNPVTIARESQRAHQGTGSNPDRTRQSPRVSVSLNFATFVAIAVEKGTPALMLTGIFACGDISGGVLLSLPDRGPNPSLAYTAGSTGAASTFG